MGKVADGDVQGRFLEAAATVNGGQVPGSYLTAKQSRYSIKDHRAGDVAISRLKRNPKE